MNIKLELLSGSIAEAIQEIFLMHDIDHSQLVDTKATKVLGEIKDVICDSTLDDFDAIDKIVDIFIKYKIDIGGRHDFG